MSYSPKVVNSPKDEKSKWSFTTKESNAILEKGWKTYQKCFALVDEGSEKNPPEKKESYHLPHHKLKDGKITLYWSGLKAAMAAVNGARNKSSLSVEDRKKAYNHLVKHYKALGKEPPKFKENLDDIQATEESIYLKQIIKKQLI